MGRFAYNRRIDVEGGEVIDRVMDGRLRSLDVLRGYDMFWIIGGERLVLGLSALSGWSALQWASGQLGHAEWNGFTFYDLIFPLFIFISGAAFSYSSAKYVDSDVDGRGRRTMAMKITRRALILVILGVIYNNGLFWVPFDEMRYPSVLGRIGLAYLIGGLATLYIGRRKLYVMIPTVLIGYWLVLLYLPWPGLSDGDRLSLDGNIVGAIDQSLLPGTLFLGNFDPEGLLSTIPAAVNFLGGVLAADMIRLSGRARPQDGSARPDDAVKRLIGMGIAALGVGALWNVWFPINKNLWTSSFVCVTVGLSALLLAMFYWLVDLWGPKVVAITATPFGAIGRNSILIYMAPLLINFEYTTDSVFGGVVNRLPDPDVLFLVWSLCFVAIKVVMLMWLDRRKLYLKV